MKVCVLITRPGKPSNQVMLWMNLVLTTLDYYDTRMHRIGM